MPTVLAVLSDTHGDAARCARAVALLSEAGARTFVHAGDVGDGSWAATIAVLDALAGTGCSFVWGNNDVWGAERSRAEAYARDLGLVPLGESGRVQAGESGGGLRVGVTHGDAPARVRRVAAGVDLVVTGHTHVWHDRVEAGVRRLNPGALYRAREKTVATVTRDGADLVVRRHVVD